jgi:hypothetical protein
VHLYYDKIFSAYIKALYIMRILTLMTATFAVFLALSIEASAQRTRTPVKRPATPVIAPQPSADIRDGSEKVATQIKNVTRFLYTLGGIAVRIEDIDNEARSRTLSRSVADTNAANKAKIIQAIRNLRSGITALEVEFRTKPNLRRYISTLDGASILVAESEDLAIAGRFSEAGRPLLGLVERLSDTLAELP